MSRHARLALAGAALLGGCAHRPPEAVRLVVSYEGGRCAIADATMPERREIVDPERFDFKRWRGREIHIEGGLDTPYRCLGAVIFGLQRVGATRIGFISEPAQAAGDD